VARRWVRYETPVTVCVDVDEHTGDAAILRVVSVEPDDIHPAHDHTGGLLVYDQQMERLGPDTAAEALIAAGDRSAWPAPDSPDWEQGPDPLRFPGLYDDGDTTDHEREPVALHGEGRTS
jgi:hypothetical protein